MSVESREARNFGFRNSDFGLDRSIPRSASDRPCSAQPPAPSPQPPRRAISLTEVLIAMGILTLGLLGVAAIFPVGGWYIQKADIADRGSAIAQSVMSDIVARGMLNPSSWYVMVPYNRKSAGNLWDTGFPSDGKFATSLKLGTFSRPFALTLNEALSQPAVATDPTLLGKQFGSAYVLDPLGLSVMAYLDRHPNASFAHGPAAVFPATAYNGFGYYVGDAIWNSWLYKTTGSASSSGNQWPIRRATFREPATSWPLDTAMAEHYFRGSDDLATDLPQRADRPVQQKWDATTVSGSPYPLARQWTRDYSWIVTVAPTSTAARNGMATNPEGYDYDVSVVVYYKRLLAESIQSVFDPTKPTPDIKQFVSTMGINERMVRAQVVSTGLSGGELLLTDWGDYYDASGTKKYNAFEGLKVGQWIMMCGPHPNSTATDPRFVLNWYQVLSIDTEGTGINGFNPTTQRVVALRGPEWPWQPRSSYLSGSQGTDVAKLSDNLCVAICRGAVAVHTKTMHLESPLGSTAPTFGTPGGL